MAVLLAEVGVGMGFADEAGEAPFAGSEDVSLTATGAEVEVAVAAPANRHAES